ncbi:unnamed protein product [Paramecium sonneborni]|uniref:WD40-repeat-containing domain n=1 Tax=Paramecium sonneborni TaxID=65129 RepID=A0A8S1MPD9_9CILI|nr:unnamed protein product [Paramecium sonneborni]
MFQSRLLINNSSIQCSNNHTGSEILQIRLDDEYKGSQKLMCSECITNQRGISHVMSFVEATDKIYDLKNQQYEQIVESIRPYKIMLDKQLDILNNLQTRIYELISSLKQKIEDWKTGLNELLLQYCDCDLLKEIDNITLSPNQILEKQQQVDAKNIDSINNTYYYKANEIIQTLKSEIHNWNPFSDEQGKFYNFSIKQNFKQIQTNVPITIKIQEIKQQQSCWAIAFNNSNSIMVAGSEENIKIWNYQNKQFIDSGIILKGHFDYVQCLTFSKTKNWFASSGLDEQIICWNQISINEWQGNKFNNYGQGVIQCLILTKNEDLLISSHDQKIKLWNVNQEFNTITFKQQLEMHKLTVLCICINDEQTFMISSALDNQIILWQKNFQNNWSFKCIINKTVKDCGTRISFISNQVFTWQQKNQGILHIFCFENGEFIEKPELNVKFNLENEQDGSQLFPSIYNKHKQILIIKHQKNVYIMKKDNQNQLKLYGDPIKCETQFNYGAITNDCSYLVIWNLETRSFNLYQLNL